MKTPPIVGKNPFPNRFPKQQKASVINRPAAPSSKVALKLDFVDSAFFTPLINSPFPVSLGFLLPIPFKIAPANIAIMFAIVNIAIADEYHIFGSFPVTCPQIWLIGIAPAPFPPPIIGSA